MKAFPLEELLIEVIDHRGKTPKKLGTDFAPRGVPVASAQLVTDGILDLSECRYVDMETWQRWMPVPVEAGDILLTSEAPLGRTARLDSSAPMVLGQRLFALRVRAELLDSRYLFFWLRSQPGQAALAEQATGSTVLGIRQSALRRIKVPVPELSTQRAIGEVLGALDDKIAANRRVQQSIDDLLESAFRRVSRTANESVELGSLIVLNYGKSLPSAIRAEGTVPVVGSGGVVGYHDAHLVDGPAVVVGRKGSVGSTYWISEGCYPIDTTYWVTPSGVSLGYAYRLLQSIDFVSMNTDSAVPGLNRERAYALQVPLPDEEQLEQFDRLSESLTLKHSALQKETGVLASARDELLPLLMAGRIAVREAERAAEALL